MRKKEKKIYYKIIYLYYLFIEEQANIEIS